MVKQTLRFQILAFAAIRTVVNTMHRMIYPFLPVFARGLGVDITALSLALTARSAIGIFSPFIGSAGDSRGHKLAMTVGLSLFTLSTAAVVFWPIYPVFFAALILSSLGKIVFDPPMQAYLGDRIPYERRGRALAVTELGWSLAFVLGVPLMGFLIARGGWMSPFGILTILGLFSIGLLIWMIPPDPARQAAQPSIFSSLLQVIVFPPMLAVVLIGMMSSAANELVNLVFGVWLEDSFGLQIAALGGAAAVIGLAELGGESLVGMIVDRIGKPRAIALGLLGNCGAVVLLPVLGGSVGSALFALFLFYLSFEFTIVSTIPMVTEVYPSARATAMAVNIAGLALGRALGALIGPGLFVGGIGTSAGAAVVFNVVALLALWWLSRQKIGLSHGKGG